MKIIYNKYIPGKQFAAINLFGIIFARNDYGQLSEVDINHEKIHSCQMRETFIVFFYLLYAVEWVVRFFQYRDVIKAYYNISFEREAYHNMYNLSYPKKRKLFMFTNYYRKRK